MPVNPARIAAIRAFNRFYTRIIGLLGEGMHQSPYSLAEARVIHEIGKGGGARAGELAGELGMDAGQMSRLIWKLVGQGLAISTPSGADRRINTLSLTPEGRTIYSGLNQASDEAVTALIAPLGEKQQRTLVESMQAIGKLLGQKAETGELVLRPPRIGELGWLIHRQAVLYNQEYGWNAEFEALIANIYSAYETAPQTPPKALWIAERDGEIAGSVFVIPAEGRNNTAQLRMLYVEPFARGQKLGQRLVAEAVNFSRHSGYERIVLWTQDCLHAARKTYQNAGFELVREGRHVSFGHKLNGQYWELDLRGGNATLQVSGL